MQRKRGLGPLEKPLPIPGLMPANDQRGDLRLCGKRARMESNVLQKQIGQVYDGLKNKKEASRSRYKSRRFFPHGP